MTARSVEWLSGLLEGEGCFKLDRSSGSLRIQVALQMTDEDVVVSAASLFPGASRVTPVDKGNHKTGYSVTWSGKQAADLMWAVLPFMGHRRSDRILSNLADWLEHQMAECQECGREFSRQGEGTSRRTICGDSCRTAMKTNSQRARRAIKKGT